jgi:hypothetical protein
VFECHLRHGCFSSSFCVVLPCVGRVLCDGLITRPEESYGCLNRLHNVSCDGQGPCKDCTATDDDDDDGNGGAGGGLF